MSAPTAPTLRTIAIEALTKAGYSGNQLDAKVQRAENYFAEEVKHDIWRLAQTMANGRLKSLQKTTIDITVQNQSKYTYPSDYSSDLTVTLMHGGNRGTAQTQTPSVLTEIKLSTTEDITQELILGKGILIYAGDGVDQMLQCIAYNTTSKIATLYTSLATATDSTSSYMVVDTYYPLIPKGIWELDKKEYQTTRGIPEDFYHTKDMDSGEFILYPVPYHLSGVPFGMQLRYYADLLRLDLASTLMTTLYAIWRNEFIQGIYVKALQDMQDSSYPVENQKYENMLKMLISRESYGFDLSTLQAKVEA